MDRKVVLVVNDEPVLRHVIAAALDDAGFDVIQAADGEDYARGPMEMPIDLVVLAANTAASNVVRQLRQIRPDVKALLLNDRPVPGNDADAVLHMPFHADDIRDAAVALAFGRCRCPSCLRRPRRANE